MRLDFALLMVAVTALPVFAKTTYRKPPKEILDVLNAPETPRIYVSPSHDYALLAKRLRYPPIAEVAEPMLRLAGVRVNPKTNGPHRITRYVGFTLLDLNGGATRELALPAGATVITPRWSPDGAHFAFLAVFDDRVEPWVGAVTDASLLRLAGLRVNAAFGQPIRWMPDSRSLLVQAISADRGDPPPEPAVPDGPIVQESRGAAGPVRTYQDLLKDEHDEALFDYYAASQLVLIDTVTGKAAALGRPGVYDSAAPSPDGKLLLVERVRHPYSYLLPYYRFPYTVEVWRRDGSLVKRVVDLPLAKNVPIGGVPTGPRGHRWHPLAPETLLWVEALDEGDPNKKVPHRDRLLEWEAPFTGDPIELYRVEQRFSGLSFGERGQFAFVRDYDRDQRWVRTFRLDLSATPPAAELVWSRALQDRYADAGSPVTRVLASGYRAILEAGDSILLSGAGASPQGDHPFLDLYNRKTGETERLFHCAPGAYEYVIAVLDDHGRRFLTMHQTPTSPPNYVLHDLGKGSRTALTHFEDPVPQIRSITKRRVTYKRDDGVDLSFTLYLPPGYKKGEDGPLPTVMWAYPREYNNPKTAGQIRGSTERFTLLTGPSHLFFLLRGYAVLDSATLPVVGDPETANDTYIEQIVAGAKAAIEKAAELGVTDPHRVAIAGHSYGAFMTANLLAHSDLFRAGIARSGAYNRTLTPFGFQAERRTFWEAPRIYFKMSPFMHADKINEPLLLIHGAADNNAGTFPIQSERMYAAISGNGGTVRLVKLPHESHGYAARESIETVLAEMIDWLDQYVKNPPKTAAP